VVEWIGRRRDYFTNIHMRGGSYAAACVRRFRAALILMGLLTAAPAKAEIEKFTRQCDGKLCALSRASVTITDGWIGDGEASARIEHR